MSVHRRKKKGKFLITWWYDFWVSGRRYRGSIPEARTKWQAERAETKIRDSIYEGKFGKQVEAPTLGEFFDKTYFPWSKANKHSWRHDDFRSRPLLAAMGNKRLDEIGVIQIERYKQDRLKAKTRFDTPLSPASINQELELLSGIFTYAIDTGLLIPNPCRKVRRLDEDNEPSRYLSQDEEKRLLAQLTCRHEHLGRIVRLAIRTLMRKSELLSLRKVNVDFERNVIWVANSRRERTKGKRGRPIPMNSLVRAELLAQCGASESEYVFPSNSKTRHLED
ncbi:MAG TPA: site-specific integrase [Pyrinomonadaceae bacterium]|jgi:integrase